jgi:hypothetical protein
MAAASDTSPVERMENILTCAICENILKEPRILDCFHSFCVHCLAKYIEIQREETQEEHEAEHLFDCPTCKTQFQLGQDESVEGLPANYFINNMLDIMKIQKAQKLPCEACKGQGPAQCRCIGCEHYLCKNCLNAHNNRSDFKNHDVLTLEELTKPENQSKARAKPRCQKHGHENKPTLEIYCNTCEELACINCVVLDHPPAHDYQPIEVVAEEHKKALKTTSDILQKKSSESQNALKKIKDAVEFLGAKTARDAILKQKEEILNEFTRQLEVKTDALLGEVDESYCQGSENLSKQQNIMKAYVEKVNGSLVIAKNVIEKGSSEDILSIANKIKMNAEDIEQECPKLMQPTGCTCVEYQAKSTKTIFDSINVNDLGNVGRPKVLKCLYIYNEISKPFFVMVELKRELKMTKMKLCKIL